VKTTWSIFALILALAALCFSSLAQAQAVNLQFVTIGNPGNANDTTGYGGVSYAYCIAKYTVTLTQYTAFLNAAAQTDPYNLYTPALATDLNVAGISRSGAAGSYSYAVIGDGNRPVTYISWLDAARFVNWLNNGQPTGIGEVAGSTEQGAYTLNGDITSGLETKNTNAQFWIPSENEWYKAAYYDPNYGGSGVGGYWQYATRSNSTPGNAVASGVNNANYNNGVYCVTQSATLSSTQNYLTPVGAFANSGTAYGTFDQGGNVFQWNDAIIGTLRGMRGGAWTCGSCHLGPSCRSYGCSEVQLNARGFRVASSSLNLAQTISFSAIAEQSSSAAPFLLNATATSGLPVSYSLVSGPATLAGTNNNTVTVTGVGQVSIRATQAGNSTYAAANVTQIFTVAAPIPFTGNPTATPQHDGVSNLLKYLFDINPSVPVSSTDRAALAQVGTTMVSGTKYLTLTYRQYALETGITVNLQSTSDLQNWTTVKPPDFSQQVGVDSTTRDPIMEVGVKTNGSIEQFIRLNVTQP